LASGIHTLGPLDGEIAPRPKRGTMRPASRRVGILGRVYVVSIDPVAKTLSFRMLRSKHVLTRPLAHVLSEFIEQLQPGAQRRP
jgi:hypothetical protein